LVGTCIARRDVDGHGTNRQRRAAATVNQPRVAEGDLLTDLGDQAEAGRIVRRHRLVRRRIADERQAGDGGGPGAVASGESGHQRRHRAERPGRARHRTHVPILPPSCCAVHEGLEESARNQADVSTACADDEPYLTSMTPPWGWRVKAMPSARRRTLREGALSWPTSFPLRTTALHRSPTCVATTSPSEPPTSKSPSAGMWK